MIEPKIRVILRDGKEREVKPFQLDKLLSPGKVRKFLRSGRWVTVGKDTLRVKERHYTGSERRKLSTIKFL